MAKKTKLEKIAEKLAKVAQMVFPHAYKKYAWEYRAKHDLSLNADEVITMQNARCNCGLSFTIDHRGKMQGMYSLSTSCVDNPICAERAKDPDSICFWCFARRHIEAMPNNREPLAKNLEILSSEIIEDVDLPIINAAWFRFESFGDLMNVTQAINYLNIVRKNPQTFFAWWTKNPAFIDLAFKLTGYEKPANLNIIYSSPRYDEIGESTYWFVDKVFTVFSPKFLAEHPEIQINCGARSCLKCRLCYEKNNTRHVFEIRK